VLRSEILSDMCAKLRTVATSNNRDPPTRSLFIACSRHIHIFLFFELIPFVVNHTIKRNTNGENATLVTVQWRGLCCCWLLSCYCSFNAPNCHFSLVRAPGAQGDADVCNSTALWLSVLRCFVIPEPMFVIWTMSLTQNKSYLITIVPNR